MVSSEEDTTKLEWLQVNLARLQEGVNVSSLDGESRAQLRQLLSLHDDALAASARSLILESLSFEDMRRRYDTVEDAHFKTFHWMFDGEGPE